MDERQRRLEREGAYGDLHARARHLRGRVRSADLRPERLALAAWLGDEAARLASVPSPRVLTLLGYGHDADCPTLGDPPPADLREQILAAIDARANSPDYVTRSLTPDARGRALAELGVTFLWPGEPPTSICPLCAQSLSFLRWLELITVWGQEAACRTEVVLGAILLERMPNHEDVRRDLGRLEALVVSERFCDFADIPRITSRPEFYRRVVQEAPEAQMRAAIRAALLPWALD